MLEAEAKEPNRRCGASMVDDLRREDAGGAVQMVADLRGDVLL